MSEPTILSPLSPLPAPYDLARYEYRHYPDKPLRGYQREIHQATALVSGHAAFWQPRTGKSRLIVDTFAAQYEARATNGCLVLAPNRVHEGWPDQVALWTPDRLLDRVRVAVYRTGSSGTKRQAAEMDKIINERGMNVLCMSYDGAVTEEGWAVLQAFLKKRPSLLVADESSRIKTPTIELTLRLVGGKKGKRVYEGARALARSRRILDGTPVSNETFDVYAPVKFLDEHFWSRECGLHDYWAFTRYFGVWDRGYRYDKGKGKKVEYPQFVRYRNMAQMRELLDKVGSRVRRDDEMDVPPKIYTQHRFDLSHEQRERYDRLEEGFNSSLAEYLAGGREAAPARQNALTRMLRMCQVASGFEGETFVVPSTGPGVKARKESRIIWRSKKNPRLELLESLCENETTQACIWCAYREEVDQVCRMLGSRAARFDGAVSDDTALENKAAFQRGDKQYTVSIPAPSSAFGHDFAMAMASRHYGRGWRLILEQQAEDRTQGPAQKHKVAIDDLIARGTKDEDKMAAILRKEDIQGYLLRDPASGRIRPEPEEGEQEPLFSEYE